MEDDPEIFIPVPIEKRTKKTDTAAIWTQSGTTIKSRGDSLTSLQEVLYRSINPEKIIRLWDNLLDLCEPTNEDKKNRLDAIKYAMDRIDGKPLKEISVKEERVTRQLSLNLSSLSDDELAQLEQLQIKALPEEHEET